LKPAGDLPIEPIIFDSLFELSNQDIPNGRFRVWQSEVKFECLYNTKEKSDYLYVFLSDSREEHPEKRPPLPRFDLWSWHSLFNGSTLYVEDPMLYKHEELNNGFYYGSEDTSYLELTLNIVNTITKKTGNPKVIFYGNFFGGYAALQLASMLPKSLAIAINPIIKFDKTSASNFFHITNIDPLKKDKFGRNSTDEKIRDSLSRFFIIQNLQSIDDFKAHLSPLCKTVDLLPDFGLSQKNNVLTWIYSAPTESNNTNNAYILFYILDLALKFFNTADYAITKLENQTYKIVSELWHDSSTLQSAKRPTDSSHETDVAVAKESFKLSKQQEMAGRLDESLHLARKAVALDPTNTTHKLYLAELLKKNKNTDAAEELLLQILIKNPLKAIAHFQLSLIYNAVKKPEKSLFHAQKSTDIDAKNINFRNNLTNILRSHKKLDEAMQSSQKAMQISPNSGWAHVQLSRILVDMNDFRLALKSAQNAVKTDPENEAFAKNLELVNKCQEI
jgi:tetratricopeptide (TPR) repeat protein